MGFRAPRSSAVGLPGNDQTAFIPNVTFINCTHSDFTPSSLSSSNVRVNLRPISSGLYEVCSVTAAALNLCRPKPCQSWMLRAWFAFSPRQAGFQALAGSLPAGGRPFCGRAGL